MAHELKTEYGKLVDTKLRASLVTKDNVIFNTKYEGVPTSGAVKVPVRDDEVTVGDYNTANIGANGVTYGTTKYITAVIDNDKFVNEYIDGYEAEAVPDTLVADRLESAAYSLAFTEDAKAIQTLVYALEGKDKSGVAFTDVRKDKTGSVTAVALTKSNAFAEIVKLGVALDNAKVPAEGRYLIVTPDVYALLLQDSNFVRQAQLSQEILMTGAVGQIAGFTVYKAATLKNATATKQFQAIAGHPSFATRIEAWNIEPKLVDGNSDANVVGGSFVKGRFIFTHEVTKPQAFAGITLTA